MLTASPAPRTSLRVLCLEDNPLIVFHLQQMIEDLEHEFAGAFESFSDMREQVELARIDCVLIDVDLTDGRTGPNAAAWLHERGVPTLFVTGQDLLAREHRDIVLDVVAKPVSPDALRVGLDKVVAAIASQPAGVE